MKGHEILEGVFDEYAYDPVTFERKKVGEYHIFLEGKTVKIYTAFPVEYMKILRRLLRGYKYDNIIIGAPWI